MQAAAPLLKDLCNSEDALVRRAAEAADRIYQLEVGL